MDSLATKRTPAAVEFALRNLPTQISDMYDQIMERLKATNDDDRDIVMNFLQWIAFASRPLSVAEIEHASAIVPGTKDFDRDNILEARELASMCAGLVVVDSSNRVRLVHLSAQDYFREHRERWFFDGHATLARKCLTYLSYTEFDAGVCSGLSEKEDFGKKVEQYPLIDYCCSCWGFHARKTQQSDELSDQICAFLTNRPHLEFAAQAMWYSDNPYLVGWSVKSGHQSLHVAAFFGLEQVMLRLIRSKCSVNCRDSPGTTPLMWAAAGGHTTVVQFLLQEGADPNLFEKGGITALHCAIGEAVTYQRADIVSLLLHAPGLQINKQMGEGLSTALNVAARNGNVQIVQQILTHPDVDVHKGDAWYTPLLYAAGEGHTCVVEALLDHGADPNIQDGAKQGDWTALGQAVTGGYITTIKLLLSRGANPKVTDNNGRTIIHIAARMGRNEVLRMLFDEFTGVDVDAQATDGRTALHIAVFYNNCETIKVLCQEGARIEILDGYDRSPLDVAKDIHNLKALELLHELRSQKTTQDALGNNLNPGGYTLNLMDNTKMGLHAAVRAGAKDIVECYIETSKIDQNVDLNLVDFHKYSALHLAVMFRRIDILSILISAPRINLNNLDHFARSPLILCAILNHSDAAALLLDAGADYAVRDNYDETALAVSLAAHCENTVGLLIMEAGAMPSKRYMRIALCIAAQWGSVKLMERLVRDGGGDPEMKAPDGSTLVRLAETCGNRDMVDVVLRLCEEKARKRKREEGDYDEDGRENVVVVRR
ncbi:MAG: hypothetical protein Q9219_004342 [cf. Caloplaca sp. 3 TL-2023]